MFDQTVLRWLATAALGFGVMSSTFAAQLVVSATRDATLFAGQGNVANGTGPLFVGLTVGGESRRSLAYFDVSSIPAGSTIQSAQLTISVNKIPASSQEAMVTLHRLSASWGEGPSAGLGAGDAARPGDTTWTHRIYPNQLWGVAGGEFVAQPSASVTLGGLGAYTVPTTPGLKADVQHWVNNPGQNFGWMIKDIEVEQGSAKQILSRESGFGPRLTVVYELPSAVSGDSDVPLPAWALALLGIATLAGLSRRGGKNAVPPN